MIRRSGFAAALAAVSLLCASFALAQSSSGVISGRVLDAAGVPIPAASVTLTRNDTGEARAFSASALGEFVFTSLQPGTYDLEVKSQGFKNLLKTGLTLAASERLSAGDLKMQLGT